MPQRQETAPPGRHRVAAGEVTACRGGLVRDGTIGGPPRGRVVPPGPEDPRTAGRDFPAARRTGPGPPKTVGQGDPPRSPGGRLPRAGGPPRALGVPMRRPGGRGRGAWRPAGPRIERIAARGEVEVIHPAGLARRRKHGGPARASGPRAEPRLRAALAPPSGAGRMIGPAARQAGGTGPNPADAGRIPDGRVSRYAVVFGTEPLPAATRRPWYGVRGGAGWPSGGQHHSGNRQVLTAHPHPEARSGAPALERRSNAGS